MSIAAVLVLLPKLFDHVGGDIPVYYERFMALTPAHLAYVDEPFEYPIYAYWGLKLPLVFGDNYRVYRWCLQLSLLVVAAVAAALLGRRSRRTHSGLRQLGPQSLWWFTVVAGAFVITKRFDLWPAGLTLCAFILMSEKKHFGAGVTLGVAAGLKVYPVVFVLPWWWLSVREQKGRAFAGGVAASLVPALVALAFIPWWRFLLFHAGRGLEVESWAANLVWLSHLLAGTDASWVDIKTFIEVQGSAALAVLPFARGLFAVSVLGSFAYAMWLAIRAPLSPSTLARSALLPLAAFVVFNLVLSPQYLLWLVALVAAWWAFDSPPLLTLGSLAVAVLLSPFIYPSPTFVSGLDVPTSVLLFARNCALLTFFVSVVKESGADASDTVDVQGT